MPSLNERVAQSWQYRQWGDMKHGLPGMSMDIYLSPGE
jgi:hypothetical protein